MPRANVKQIGRIKIDDSKFSAKHTYGDLKIGLSEKKNVIYVYSNASGEWDILCGPTSNIQAVEEMWTSFCNLK
jgi:hypothetical protein